MRDIKKDFFGGNITKYTLYNEILKDEYIDGKSLSECNEILLKCLSEKLRKDGLQQVLPVLGAGVSVRAGIPTWDKLLHTMWCINGISKIEIEATQLFANGDLETGEKLGRFIKVLNSQKMIPPHSKDFLEYAQYFWNDIAESYSSSQRKEESTRKLIEEQFIRKVKEALSYPGKTWDETALQNQKETALGKIGQLVKDYNLNVITYNFDDLLEAYLKISNPPFQCKCIQDAQKMYREWDVSNVKIYHVHGCIPLTDFSGATRSQRIIFSESEYNQAEQYAYEWLNAVQAERIHRKDLMIVGFAAQDYNFKRILRNMPLLPLHEQKKIEELNVDTQSHFIFLPIEDILNDIELPRDENVKPEDEEWKFYIIKAVQIFMRYKSEYLKQYGMYPIWTSYEALPEMLNTLRKDFDQD